MNAERILVVEDDLALLEGVRDILELAGYQVATAGNGVEGLAALDTFRAQLIISDIMMPRMDGYAFFETVRARPEHLSTPFIFLSAKGDKADIRRGKQLGADDYVVKPFDEEDLLVVVRAKLDRQTQLDAAQAQQMDELKRTILVTLNHEFRTPLTYITSYTDLLGESGTRLNSGEFKSILHGIQLGSDRLRRLVEDFILLVELQTGEAEQTYLRRRGPITDLPGVLGALLERYAETARGRKVKLAADLPEGLPPIVADREYLLNALGRLVDNAIKFSHKDGGQVTLSARLEAGRLVISVQDQGMGIRPEAMTRLFDVFFQIDRAKREQQGSGSGLAIARGITRLHGGNLSATSEPGQGSTFTVDLPIT